MSRSAQTQISLTKDIRFPNQYIQALYKEYKDWAFDELKAPQYKGKWRELFSKKNKTALHLEIGPGNGRHFARLCLNHPEDCFLSIELKYKALIQTIRRVRQNKSENGKVIRYNACLLENLFKKGEINNIYLHFPDPWLKKRKSKKHQMIKETFCKILYERQRSKSFLEFKTDSRNYFHQSVHLFKKAGYKMYKYNLNLYKNQKYDKRFMNSLSQFELLFVQKKIPIKICCFFKRVLLK